MKATTKKRIRKVQPKPFVEINKQKERSCLRCGKTFLSLGPWNRVCKNHNDPVLGLAGESAPFRIVSHEKNN